MESEKKQETGPPPPPNSFVNGNKNMMKSMNNYNINCEDDFTLNSYKPDKPMVD